jgi:Single-stranded DNA-binding replication protein A (RPA), large (70 kD) subunit and related ssDNA-binding proteins
MSESDGEREHGGGAPEEDGVAAVYAEHDIDVSLGEFRGAVAEKVDQMGGLADEESAAMLVAHELDEQEVETVADIEPGMEDVQFTAKVVSVGDLNTFDRDDGEEGRVLNADVADETGSVRVTFWDRLAEEAGDQLSVGDVIAFGGRPADGYNGVEVNVDDVKTDVDATIDVQPGETHQIDDLSMGLSDVTVRGRVLDVGSVRTFDRDDGSQGRVAGVTIGDPTGRIRVTLWGDQTESIDDLTAGDSIEVVDGYVRERDGDLELHCNDRSELHSIEESVEYTPDSTPIGDLAIDTTVNISGVVRTADPKRTFDRDDGSQGQVRNVRVQDDTGDIRVALWGDKADRDIGPGDRVAFADVEVEDGWQDDLEASANWRSTVTVLEDGSDPASEPDPNAGDTGDDGPTGLDAYADGEAPASSNTGSSSPTDDDERVEFTGTVVQAGDPVVLDDGTQTVRVETGASVHLGEEVTVRGRELETGHIDAEEVR